VTTFPVTAFVVFCTIPLVVTGLLWLAARFAERRGWIVRRTEPRPEWAELGQAQARLGRAVADALRMPQLAGWLDAQLRRWPWLYRWLASDGGVRLVFAAWVFFYVAVVAALAWAVLRPRG
jgi:hypothetical protein